MKARAAQLRTLVRLRRQQAERRQVPVDERLRRLVAHARDRSPHYRRVLAGLEGAPLDALPVLTKADLVDRFDDIVTVDALRGGVSLSSPPRGYRLAVSSGSSGRPATVAFDADAVRRAWRILAQVASIFEEFRGGFTGKVLIDVPQEPCKIGPENEATARFGGLNPIG